MVRFKNRYMVFELVWKDGKVDDTISEAVLLSVFRESIQQNFGDYGLGSALASFQVKFYNPVTSLCVLRCGRDEYRQIWCAVTLLTSIKNRVVLPRLVHLTGTVAACRQAVQQLNAARVARLKLTSQMARLSQEAEQRLQAMEL